MDAGVAAIIGAAIGALVAPLTSLLSRKLDRRDKALDREQAARQELRAALLAVHESFHAILATTLISSERVRAGAQNGRALAQLDLLVGSDDEALIVAASKASRLLILEHPEAANAAGLFRQTSSRWFRGSMSARDALKRLQDARFDEVT